MFNNTRYMTRGIQEEVHLGLQIIIWQLIDDCKAKGLKLDYLQVFELSTEVVGGQLVQVIQHRQEEPLYRRTHRFAPIEVPQETTIWAIDDGDHSTMLLPSEY
ncbi:DUF960 family protein [Paenibacillus sp. IITD108]|uniref:DUF960 family protein n=1 Tax=Paenibacillus sp. IITD108 TaxID=3116649 RepID=UPI002F407781